MSKTPSVSILAYSVTELGLLMFVCAVRQSDFDLYIEALSYIMPWFFSLNHHNYARWVSVHLRDMTTLGTVHPDVDSEFRCGKFTVNKSNRPFSAIALDQAHEQLNALVKGVGGAVGLMEKPDALLRWMAAGPQIARAVNEFEEASHIDRDVYMPRHHEQTKSQQVTFVAHVSSPVTTLEEMSNPFMDDGSDIYAIDTLRVCAPDVVQTVQTVEATGQSQCKTFCQQRLVECIVPVTAPITRNKNRLFTQSSARKTKPTQVSKLAAVRNDCSLFSRLYIACQTRSGDLDTFFSHENQPYPPSLSNNGSMRFGSKSDLLACLENLVGSKQQCPLVDASVLDGAAIVQMLSPGRCVTFSDYAKQIFVPYVVSQLSHVSRLDLVWDQYDTNSLKAATRAKRGIGIRRKVMATADLPRNWADFLRNDDNKTELFHFLSARLATTTVAGNKRLVVTDGCHALSCQLETDSALDPCSHEEADTRILLHAAHAAANGHTRVMIKTADTDVVVLAIACFERIGTSELWIAFGAAKNLRFIAVHELVKILGSDRCKALPFFHAFTGCDTVSSFAGHGKRTAWETWNCFPDVTDAFFSGCG